jgi:hypothetical protein
MYVAFNTNGQARSHYLTKLYPFRYDTGEILSKPAPSHITPLQGSSEQTLSCGTAAYSTSRRRLRSYFPYFLLRSALSQRLLRPRAKAASNSRWRCCHPRCSVCLGDVRKENKCILCYPLLAWMNLRCTLPSKCSIVTYVPTPDIQHVELNFSVTPKYSGSTYTHAYEQPTPSQTPHHPQQLLDNLWPTTGPAYESALTHLLTAQESPLRYPPLTVLPARCLLLHHSGSRS